MRRFVPSLLAITLASAGLAQTVAPGMSRPFGLAPVGPTPASPPGTLATAASATSNLSILSGAIAASGIAPTLAGPGPYTLFAPTNAAFGRLAGGSLDLLMRPENKPSLAKLLDYHVVPGRITVADLKQRIAAGGGTTTLVTLEGEPITVTLRDNAMLLTDGYGNKSYVETPDMAEANGVVHLVNGVLLPKLG